MKIANYIVLVLLISSGFIHQGFAQNICLSSPDATLENDTFLICYQSSIRIEATNCTTGDPLAVYWAVDNDVVKTSATFLEQPFTGKDVHEVLAIAGDGSGNQQKVYIKQRERYSTEISESVGKNVLIKCPDDSITFHAQQIPEAKSYEWTIEDVQNTPVSYADTFRTDFSDGDVFLFIVDQYNCRYSVDAFPIVPAPTPVSSLGDDTTICAQDKVTLSTPEQPAGFISYSWAHKSASGTWSTLGSSEDSYQASSPGEYAVRVRLRLSDANCYSYDTISIDNYEKPDISIDPGPATTVCPKASVQFNGIINDNTSGTASGTAPYTYSWFSDELALSDTSAASVETVASAEGSVTLMVTDDNNCRDTATTSVTLFETGEATTAFNDSSTCVEAIDLIGNYSGPAGLGYSEIWESMNRHGQYQTTPAYATGAGPYDSGILNVEPDDTTIYFYIVTDDNGCMDTATTRVNTPDMEVNIEQGYKIPLCENNSIELTTSIRGGVQSAVNYNWVSNDAGFSGSSSDELSLTPPSGNNWYRVTYEDARGCRAVDTIYINVVPQPQINYPETIHSVCVGETVISDPLNPVGGSGEFIYHWQSASGNYKEINGGAQVEVTGTDATASRINRYTVQVEDAGGCVSNIDTVNVEVISNPSIFLAAAMEGCTGENLTLDPTDGTVNSDYSYEWNHENTSVAGTAIHTTSAGGKYYLEVTDNISGCTSMDSIDLFFVEPPVSVSASGPETAPNHLPVKLDASGTGERLRYEWVTNGAGELPASDRSNIKYNPVPIEEVGTVDFTVTAYNNCGEVDTTIAVIFETDSLQLLKPEIYVPNVFSPNAEKEVNRTLRVFGSLISEEDFSFRVYNRWGKLLYETDSFEEAHERGWNGVISGSNQDKGVYTWTVTGKYSTGGTFEESGTATMLR